MANNPVQVEIVGSTPVPVTEVWTDLRGYYAETGKPAAFGPAQARYGPTAGLVAQAVWTSPLFDLRPDLAASAGYVGNTKAVNRDVWLDGPGFRLFGELRGFVEANATLAFGVLRAYSLEYGALVDPRKAAILGTRVDITADLFASNPTTGVQWFRWNPVGVPRYWGAIFILEYTAALTFDPGLTFAWAIH